MSLNSKTWYLVQKQTRLKFFWSRYRQNQWKPILSGSRRSGFCSNWCQCTVCGCWTNSLQWRNSAPRRITLGSRSPFYSHWTIHPKNAWMATCKVARATWGCYGEKLLFSIAGKQLPNHNLGKIDDSVMNAFSEIGPSVTDTHVTALTNLSTSQKPIDSRLNGMSKKLKSGTLT